ncbi:MAG: 4-hydroxythreonine-4-phosphate dehydrogenase PdxA [Halomonadaceae bacterium]|nr:MAG: 4-hydroxythreonine-4-phosphate dehydrogenase PdxA [Halomonadaceae bacterium]
MSRAARLMLTPGEPAGVGPDLCLQWAMGERSAEVVAVADHTMLTERARQLGLDCTLVDWQPGQPVSRSGGQLSVWHLPCGAPVTAGTLNPANSAYVLATLERATRACQEGEADALVTAPVHKGVINEAGIAFSGHTEFLQAQCGVERVVMMLATEGLRVALVTTHLPLKDVPAAITAQRITQVTRILHRDLTRFFAIAKPRILVAGLNPHAGEGGHLGREELDVIIPTLEQLRSEGIQLQGPLPADTLFTPHHLQDADAVLAMYHDQGLPVLKYKGFGAAVNITLGLPIIRTSVDHGTALDLAGKGSAHGGSLNTALAYASLMVRRRAQAEKRS